MFKCCQSTYIVSDSARRTPTPNDSLWIIKNHVENERNRLHFPIFASSSHQRRCRRDYCADVYASECERSLITQFSSSLLFSLHFQQTVPTEQLSKLSNLTHLSLSGNFIQTLLPVSFLNLFQLRILRLDRLVELVKIDSR